MIRQRFSRPLVWRALGVALPLLLWIAAWGVLATGATPAAVGNQADYDAAGNLIVYTETLGLNWYDWSWTAAATAYTSTAHSGNRAIVTDLDGWGAFCPFFSNDQDWNLPEYTGLTTTDFDRLSFWVHRGASAGGQTVGVQVSDILPGWAWRHRVSFVAPTDDAWHEIVIPLSELDGVDLGLSRLAWVGNGAATEPILLDDIKLLKAPAPVVAVREPMSDTAGLHWLYRDERNARLDGSWNADFRLQGTPASRGSFSLATRFSWYGGLQFWPLDYDWQAPQPFATGTANVLQFDLNRGPLDPAGQTYDIYAVGSDGGIAFKAPLARFATSGVFDTDPTTWQTVTVPLDTLAGDADGIYAWGIQEANGVNGTTADALYLDEVRFDYRTPPPDLAIYTDTLAVGWTAAGSWDAAVGLANPAPVLTGTASLSVTYRAPWGGLYLHVDPPVGTVDYRSLRFWIHGGVVGGQPLQLWVHDDAYKQGASITLTTPLSNTWQLVQVSLADLGSPAAIRAVALQDGGGAAQPTFYLDEIAFDTAAAPPPPPRAGPALHVDMTADRHPISPDIYGMNFADEALAAELRLPVRRWGGNSTTRYNWQSDSANHASDWYFENVPESNANPGTLPAGSTVDRFIEQDRRTGTQTILTLPLIGWTPKGRDYACGFSVAKYGAQQYTDAWRPDCGNGVRPDGTLITGNAPADTSIPITTTFVQAWIGHLIGRYGAAAAGGVRFYNLDNEPMLWNHTHRDVHPAPAGYDELRDRTYEYAAAIKAADPGALTLGPVLWGWTAYFYSALDRAPGGDWWNHPPDRNAHGGLPFTVWYLQQMRAYEQQNGVRILDYLDLHYYPQAAGVALAPAGNAGTQALRLRSTRSLWDPDYADESWIAGSEGGPAVRLIPRMKEWADANYPGTKLAITEYNWGALNHINGALAQADVLGIFGREGLDLATLWNPPSARRPGAFAFRIYRNYDGAGGAFGETSVRAVSADQAQLAVYAAQRSSDDALTLVVINKTASPLTTTVTITGFAEAARVQTYHYSAANLGAIVRQPDETTADGVFAALFPGASITLVTLQPEPRRLYLPLILGDPPEDLHARALRRNPASTASTAIRSARVAPTTGAAGVAIGPHAGLLIAAERVEYNYLEGNPQP